MKRSGIADLPLHGGRVPPWLASRMATLGTAIAESVIHHYGRAAFLSRLSDPFWFQAFGTVMGMDWHSSGITTSVMGSLKRGLNPRADELGLYVCGGRGEQSRRTPDELRRIADRTSVDGEALVRTSRLTARIDNNAIADGFQIYLHSFVVTREGEWAIVQQGMNEGMRLARRYHWHSAAVRDFTADPHTAIVGESRGEIRNLVDGRAKPAQSALLAIAREDPARTLDEVRRLEMPMRHDVRQADVNQRRLGAVLALAHERDVSDFASFLLLEQLGPRTLQSLALVAEVVHGAPARFSGSGALRICARREGWTSFPGAAEGVRRIARLSQASARRGKARPHREAAWVRAARYVREAGRGAAVAGCRRRCRDRTRTGLVAIARRTNRV